LDRAALTARRPGESLRFLGAPRNPFCSERVQPGAIPFFLPEGQSLQSLLQTFADSGMQGQIIGPHGSGKSALLSHLALTARALGWRVCAFRSPSAPRFADASCLFADEWESHPAWRRLYLRALCRRRGIGLLVAAHRDMGFPTLWRAGITLEMTRQIADYLLDGWQVERPSDALLNDLYARHQGNLRLILFSLYDWYESCQTRRL
jgi:hypothetical protein